MSANDNFTLRDGTGLVLFKIRAKDVSTAGDGSLQAIRHSATPYPVDYGLGGCFQITSKSGSMAAGLTANSPIYAFRWVSSTLLGILRRVRITVATTTTGFAAGQMTFDLFRAQSWSAADTGGVTDTLGIDNGNLRTSMPGSVLSEIRHSSTAALTAGTRTLDAQPHDSLALQAATAATTVIASRALIFDKGGAADHPLVMAQNEGFVIQATVPATGVWAFAITPEWDEVTSQNY